MDREPEDDGITRLGIAGALCKEYAADERAFLSFLGESLQRAFGSEVQLTYTGGFLTKKNLRGVTLSLQDNKYTLEDPGHGSLKAKRTHFVRGIALKTEDIEIADWLATVAELTEQKVAQHAAAKKALEKMLGLN